MKSSLALLAAPIFALAVTVASHAAVPSAKATHHLAITHVADDSDDDTTPLDPYMVYRG